MIRVGVVVQQDNSGLLVRFERLAACHGCNACGREKETTTITVPGDARPGDKVAVEMPDAKVLKASLLVYLIPLAAFIAGLVLGGLVTGGQDLGMVAGGALGLLISAAALKATDKRLRGINSWQPRIVAVNPQDGLFEGTGCAPSAN